jgi:hypothetical protein
MVVPKKTWRAAVRGDESASPQLRLGSSSRVDIVSIEMSYLGGGKIAHFNPFICTIAVMRVAIS